ncbi:hypothetical protein JYQ62_09380 [Nostoc sp. UHCC 0702]|nr:hypothetical protein JYQ62_09380 [Nostoc sp. UHCC 0702]
MVLHVYLVSHLRRSRILPPSAITAEQLNRRQEQSDILAMRCRVVFERLREQLIEAHYNWFIAIDPDSENYLIDPTLIGLSQQIHHSYGDTNVKLTIFRLNDIGTCGRLWV